jgi:hypothetical protein
MNAATFFLGSLLWVCALSAQPVPPTPKPDWIERLPDAPGRLYALGTADLSGSETQALRLASDRARLEVVARLRASVKGGTATLTRTQEFKREGGPLTGSGERTVRDEVQVAAHAEDLPGLVIERTHVDPQTRTAYALAYLDVALARTALDTRLGTAVEARRRVGQEASRRARWHLRRLQGDLNRLEELSALLALTGSFTDWRARLESVRQEAATRLGQLEAADLPPVDLAKATMTLRPNLDLPGGLQDALEARMEALGPHHRDTGADFILELSFSGGDQGPALIFTEMAFAAGVTYRLEAQLRILDALGTPLTKAATISLAQAGTAEGLVDQFRRAFDRRLGRLLDDVQAELR